MIPIHYQCDDFVVVEKPAGLDFHDHNGAPGLFNQVRQQLGGAELYPVHRLDKVTSGLVVMAKTAAANRQLCQAFAEGRVEKTYLALSAKKPVKKQGAVVGDMQPGRRGAWRLVRSRENPARTAFISRALRAGVRLFVVKPVTGKTHQIRVALKSVGAPILGDALYAGAPADRTYLHAWRLRLPLNGGWHSFHLLPDTGTEFFRPELGAALTDLGPIETLSWPKA